ncbi:serine hydrolase domain-containing protein [Planctomicrobium sp. SH668]|uniref:serine hydrolase domain-containing protein n=1 Tax=Planctomicrobium sp. SH668 TaxID=3448126 RepID=UPI003F5BA6B0
MNFVLRACLASALFCSIASANDANRLQGQVDQIVQRGLSTGQYPGAVVAIGRSSGILLEKAYGERQSEPTQVSNSLETVYDIASLSKPVSTASCIMILAERGKLDLNAAVSNYLPEFAQNGKEAITIHHLLTHTSGLIADNHIRDYEQGPTVAWEKICNLKLSKPVGEAFIYSDVGFITLGVLVERVSGQTLQEFSAENVFVPLGMTDTTYVPGEQLGARAAPQNQENGEWIKGVVHDPRARDMGGIAGHAGVFSTASDLSRYARMVLGKGELDGVRAMQPETIERMLISRPVPGGGTRTWGWDRQTGFSSNRGDGMSDRSIGHGGFTGTGMWIDPEHDLYVIFLSNRLHPDGKGSVNKLIGEIGTAAMKSLDQ